LIAPARLGSRAKLLLALKSTVSRDRGYEPGYIPNYDQASHCRNRRAGHGGKITLGTTALAAANVYVTEYPRQVANARIVAIPLN
jgi:hypothetical protein